jgi:hypothetical protein
MSCATLGGIYRRPVATDTRSDTAAKGGLVLINHDIQPDFIVRPSVGAGSQLPSAVPRRGQLLRLLLPASILFAVTGALPAGAQEVQLHYDWRHSVDPRNNARNFPALTFKDFKSMEFGSFLIKVEADLNGSRNNVSKVYSEISQTLKFWGPSVFLHLEYTGGIGLFDAASGGYYLDNAYLVGAAHPFRWEGSWASTYLAYKHTNFTRASHDPQFSIYWGKGFFSSWDFASTAVMWTQNKNHGDASTGSLSGKRFSFLSENEIWYKVAPRISVGSETRISVNVYATDHKLHVYPTIGGRYQF